MHLSKCVALLWLLLSCLGCFAEPTRPELTENLIEAVEKNDLTLVKRLVSQGADVNAKARDERTALIVAIDGQQKVTPLLRYLVSRGADVNKRTKNGWKETPLFTAAHNSSIEIVEFLLKHRAKINEINPTLGQTTLNALCSICGSCACIADSETANVLVKYGANVDIANKQGNTPLMTLILTSSVYNGNEKEEKEDLILAKNLIRKSKNLSRKNKQGKTALQLAIEGKWWPVAALIKHRISSR